MKNLKIIFVLLTGLFIFASANAAELIPVGDQEVIEYAGETILDQEVMVPDRTDFTVLGICDDLSDCAKHARDRCRELGLSAPSEAKLEIRHIQGIATQVCLYVCGEDHHRAATCVTEPTPPPTASIPFSNWRSNE